MALRSIGGFTLVEVLVALFVLAVGIVGASATQLATQRTRHHSALMSAAVQLAASLADRMRANPVVMAGADGDNPYLQLRYDASGAPPATPVSCYGDAGCTPLQMAGFDLFEAAEAVRTGFPRGRIVVCRDAAIGDAAAATLAWECASAPSAPVVVKLGWRGNDSGAAPAPVVAMVVP
ncbi:MAG: type IV pilus modification protein PilV [Massilia sp.]